ncbi:MAG TPA: amino acid permease [Candidatus Saccharimonadales bacterium]|nr:amino acid permease [Candidatus Saccharimonadales bacterium]
MAKDNAKEPIFTSRTDKLRRVISTPMLALYGIGNIVGAGVYVLIGKVAEPAGYLSILAFLIAALVAFCAALCYAELAARFPVSAGISVYLHKAFKAVRLSTIIGLLLVVAGTVSTATLLKGFSGYFYSLVPVHPAIVMMAVALILLIVMLRGIKESVRAAAALTVVEVGGLLFLIASVLMAEPGAVSNFTTHFFQEIGTLNMAAMAGVLSATFIAFYAFIGFEDMVNIAEEVKEPRKAFPRAILLAMLLVTVLYLMVAVVTLGVLSPAALGSSGAPLADAYKAATGNAAGIITAISLLATLNGILVNIIMGSRFLYGLANRGWIPSWFSKVSSRQVPARGLILVTAAALPCALWLPIERLAQLTSLLLLFVFFAVNLSLIVIRHRDTKESRKLRIAPVFMPWLGAIASALLLVGQVVIVVFGL